MRLMTSACAASLTSCPFTLRIWSLAKSFSCEGPSARVHRAPSINKAFVNVCSTWVFSKTSSPITDVYQYFRAYTWSSLTRDIFAQKFPSNNLQDSSTKKTDRSNLSDWLYMSATIQIQSRKLHASLYGASHLCGNFQLESRTRLSSEKRI